jgi:hypothetical protein
VVQIALLFLLNRNQLGLGQMFRLAKQQTHHLEFLQSYPEPKVLGPSKVCREPGADD